MTKVKNLKTAAAAAKRVAIAKDVLAQLKVGRYNPICGRYWSINSRSPNYKVSQENLNVNFLCRVCMDGALVVSAIRKFNGATICLENGGNEQLVLNVLADYFSLEQLQLIEAAYEPNVLALAMSTKDSELYEEARPFREQYPDAEKRMIAICKNIIRNKGTFKI